MLFYQNNCNRRSGHTLNDERHPRVQNYIRIDEQFVLFFDTVVSDIRLRAMSRSYILSVTGPATAPLSDRGVNAIIVTARPFHKKL